MRPQMGRLSVDLVTARNMADMLLLAVGVSFPLYTVWAGAGDTFLLLLVLHLGVGTTVRIHYADTD